MTTTAATRKIVKIDPDKCDGCGFCVPSCAEGAIEIVDGKARLVAENLCDGLGNCLGECPKDAITIEERPAEAFDEEAVEQRLAELDAEDAPAETPASKPDLPCGCPGTMARMFDAADDPEPAGPKPAAPKPTGASSASGESQLRHWPVQLTLLPEQGPIWDGAEVVLAADCAAYAMPDFHDRMLTGKSLAIACPKLDDPSPYVEKLARILKANDVRSITIVRMEVPCCGGLERILDAAEDAAGVKVDRTVTVVGVDGRISQVNGVKVG